MMRLRPLKGKEISFDRFNCSIGGNTRSTILSFFRGKMNKEDPGDMIVLNPDAFGGRSYMARILEYNISKKLLRDGFCDLGKELQKLQGLMFYSTKVIHLINEMRVIVGETNTEEIMRETWPGLIIGAGDE